MSKQIWKFPIETTDRQNILIPKHSEILGVEIVNGIPCVYAIVNTLEENSEVLILEIYGTGHDMEVLDESIDRKYLGAYKMLEDRGVFHVFRLWREPRIL